MWYRGRKRGVVRLDVPNILRAMVRDSSVCSLRNRSILARCWSHSLEKRTPPRDCYRPPPGQPRLLSVRGFVFDLYVSGSRKEKEDTLDLPRRLVDLGLHGGGLALYQRIGRGCQHDAGVYQDGVWDNSLVMVEEEIVQISDKACHLTWSSLEPCNQRLNREMVSK